MHSSTQIYNHPMTQDHVSPHDAVKAWVQEAQAFLASLPQMAGSPRDIIAHCDKCTKRQALHRGVIVRAAKSCGESVFFHAIDLLENAESKIEIASRQWGKGVLQLQASGGQSPLAAREIATRAIDKVSRLCEIFESSPASNRPSREPLSQQEKQLWDFLDGRAMTGKELAAELPGRVDPQTVAKRIQRIRNKGWPISNRRTGTKGYFRDDAPPADWS